MIDGPVPTSAKGYQNESSSFWPSMAYEDAPQLRWPLNIAVYDRMRRTDPQVMSVIRAVTLPIRKTGWRIDPAGASDEVTEFVADDLGLSIQGRADHTPIRSRDRFDFGEYLRMALLKLPFGHSMFEQVYTVDAAANRAHLSKLLWLPPRTIASLDIAPDGGLKSITQFPPEGATSPSPAIPITQLVAHVNDREGGNWLGQSILRSAYKFWVLKDQLIRKQFETFDRNGMGVPVYEGADFSFVTEEADRLALEKADVEQGAALAKSFRSGTHAGASIAHSAALTLQGVSGELPNGDILVRYYDEQIAGSMLANFLTLGGNNANSSHALGSTFVDVFVQSLQAAADEVQAITNFHVIEDLVDHNFGPTAPAPRLVHDEIGARSAVTAEGLRALIECGAIRADDGTESFIRTTFGMPQHDPDTAREYKPAVTPPPALAAPPAPANPEE